jgi:hypothetical protein
MSTHVKKSEIIDRALEYLGTTSEQWCQGALARDSYGSRVLLSSSTVVSRCAEATINAAYHDLVRRADEQEHTRCSAVDDILDGLFMIFAEQYPDLQAKWGREPLTVADFNDNDLMTYEGVKATMEKYSSALKDAGE